MRIQRLAWLLLGIGLFTGTTLWGQGLTGSISGVVKDPNGGVVPNAKVTAKNVDTNAEAVTQTDDTGFYRILNLAPANYMVSAEAIGFRRTSTSPQELTIAQALRVDVNLEIGQVTETVTVTSGSSQINTEDAQLGQAITQIPNLPNISGANGRNPLNLAGLMAGVSMTPPGGTGVETNGIGPFSVNGQRTQANNYLLDGVDSNDLAINIPDSIGQISPNALAEFRIVTGAMKAEYGRNGGAVVEAITRSGGNQWHATAEEVFRNTKLNATPFFQNVSPGGAPGFLPSGAPRKPQWNTNDYDANLGGPIKKDKTFFFVSYLGFRRRQGVTNSATVFTAADRAAIQSLGTPAAKAVLALVPAASSGNTLFSAPSNSLNRDQGIARLDQRFSDRNSLSFTYFIEKSIAADPFAFGGSTVPGFGTTGVTNFYNYVLRDTETFSSNLVNDARAGFHRRVSPGVLPVNHTTPAQLGFTGINPDDAANAGPPWFIITGYSNFGNTIQGPQARNDNTWQYADTVSWVKGKHAFKFGADYRAYEQNQLFTFINNGYYIFDGSSIQQGLVPAPAPGVSAPLNDFIHGVPFEFIQNSSSHQGYRDRFASLFFQDDWKATRNLTLNLGLRWEYNAPLTELNNHLNAFRAGQQSTVFPTAPVGLVYPGDKGVPQSTYNHDWNNFGPRVGFAWDPFSNGKLSVRGGYGVFFDAPVSELTLQFLTAPPFGIQPFTLYSTDMTHPYSTATGTKPIPNPFPFSPPKPGSNFDFTNIAPVGLTVMDPNFSTPYSQQWNLQAQYQIAPSWLASVTYVGTNGVKLLYRSQIDPSVITPTASTANTNQRRIFNLGNPQDAAYGGAVFAGVTDQQSAANSNYNALQAELRTNLWHGLQMTHAYTWSHSIDDASGLRVNTTGNVYNRLGDRGNSEFDIRHLYVGSVIYALPWLKDQKGFAGHVLGGWNLSIIQTFHTGLPFDITESTDRCLCGGGGNRPDYVGGNVQFVDPRTNAFGLQNAYFDGTGGGTATAATNPFFHRVGSGTSIATGAGRYGTFGRDVFHGPGVINTDFGLSKQVRITERQTLEVRGEAFNLFNHTNFNNPQGSISSNAFGRITTALDPRLVQITARYFF
jgi:carboxypeptidase family protein/TonB-dependent receptor-like protein